MHQSVMRTYVTIRGLVVDPGARPMLLSNADNPRAAGEIVLILVLLDITECYTRSHLENWRSRRPLCLGKLQELDGHGRCST